MTLLLSFAAALLLHPLLPQAAFRLGPIGSGLQAGEAQPSTVRKSQMSDREQAGLHGRVHSCTVETTYPGDGQKLPPSTFSMTTEYTPDGRILLTRSPTPDGSEVVTTHSYDENGRLIRISTSNRGVTSAEQTYSYDDAGRLAKIASGGPDPSSVVFQYDNQGRKTKIQTFDAKPLPPGAAVDFQWEDSDLFSISVPPGGTLTTLYNEDDQPVEAQTRDAQGRLIGRIVRTIDANGRPTSDKVITEAPDLALPQELASKLNPAQAKSVGAWVAAQFSGAASYKYDAQGRVIEKRRRLFTDDEVTSISYNEHGDKEQEITTTNPNPTGPTGFTVDDQGNMTPQHDQAPPRPPSHSELRYTYLYDAYGNWTEQTLSTRSHPDDPWQVSMTYRRVLTYY